MKKITCDKLTRKTLVLLGSNIRVLRRSKNWTQEELAERANINDKEVSHIEAGRRNITIETLVKISIALGLESHNLIGLDYSKK